MACLSFRSPLHALSQGLPRQESPGIYWHIWRERPTFICEFKDITVSVTHSTSPAPAHLAWSQQHPGLPSAPNNGPQKEAWDRTALEPHCTPCVHALLTLKDSRHWTQQMCNMLMTCSACTHHYFFHLWGRTGGGGGLILAHDFGFAFAGTGVALPRPGVSSPGGTGARSRFGGFGTGCLYKRPAGKASR